MVPRPSAGSGLVSRGSHALGLGRQIPILSDLLPPPGAVSELFMHFSSGCLSLGAHNHGMPDQ